MDVGLGIAGIICLAIALGHATIGIVWVLPRLPQERLPRTPFGPAGMTDVMIRVTWHVVTIFALSLGGLLLSLALARAPDPNALLLRWFGTMWFAAVIMALFVIRRNPRYLRLPLPVVWVPTLTTVGILLWGAST